MKKFIQKIKSAERVIVIKSRRLKLFDHVGMVGERIEKVAGSKPGEGVKRKT
jgi:hypothetical protein